MIIWSIILCKIIFILYLLSLSNPSNESLVHFIRLKKVVESALTILIIALRFFVMM